MMLKKYSMLQVGVNKDCGFTEYYWQGEGIWDSKFSLGECNKLRFLHNIKQGQEKLVLEKYPTLQVGVNKEWWFLELVAP